MEYEGDLSTKTPGLDHTKNPVHQHNNNKIIIIILLSTPGAKFTTMDISNMYLTTPLKDFQYMRFHIDLIPEEVIEEYNPRETRWTKMDGYTVKFERQSTD